MARRSSGFPRARSQRRLTAWNQGTGGTGVLQLTGNASLFVGSALQALVEGVTIIRLRGYLRAILTSGASPNDGFAGAFGIGIASLAAVTAGIASVPTPITEQGSENWLYWRAFSLQVMSATFADGVNANGVFFDYEIDTRAMRKFPTDLAIYAAVEVVENGTAVMELWHDSRSLFKLP